MKSENFIPFSKRDLIGHLGGRLDEGSQREGFSSFCSLVESVYHAEFYRDLEGLKAAYAAFDPDRISGSIPGVTPAPDTRANGTLLEGLKTLLTRANYREITRERIQAAFKGASPWGLQLRVDLQRYELLALFSREEYPESSVKKTLLFKKKYDYTVFRNVALAFQLKEGGTEGKKLSRTGQGRYSADRVYLKLFKNVPTVDLEMLFPDTQIEIRLFDKAKVALPLAIGAVSSLYKIIGYALGRNVEQMWTQVGFWALVGGLFGVALKAFLGYRNTIEKYLKSLTESLYFQNLDNNSGVFKFLLDEAEEEECKELVLGYYFLTFEAGAHRTAKALDERIERYFKDELKAEIDFEVDDSLRKLSEMGLLRGAEGALETLDLDQALERLEKRLSSRA